MITGSKNYSLWAFVVVIGLNVFNRGNIMLGIFRNLIQLIISDYFYFLLLIMLTGEFEYYVDRIFWKIYGKYNVRLFIIIRIITHYYIR